MGRSLIAGLMILLFASVVLGEDSSSQPATDASCHDMGGKTTAMGAAKNVSPRAAEQMSAGASAFAAGKMDEAATAFKDAMNRYRAAGASAEFCDAAQNLAAAYQSL